MNWSYSTLILGICCQHLEHWYLLAHVYWSSGVVVVVVMIAAAAAAAYCELTVCVFMMWTVRYDEDYNRRPRQGVNKLPALRRWSSNTMSWVPEKSDYPLQG